METANYNGRRAANAVLKRSGACGPRVAAIPTYRPPEWEPFKRIDEERWRLGEANLFDAALTTTDVGLCTGDFDGDVSWFAWFAIWGRRLYAPTSERRSPRSA